MKINKKIVAITLGIVSLSMYGVFADKLDDDFRAGIKCEYIARELGVFRHVQTLKFAWASTRKEENGIETYQGRHYLRCYNEVFGIVSGDTKRVWKDQGFYLEGGRTDVGLGPTGCKANYGDKE